MKASTATAAAVMIATISVIGGRLSVSTDDGEVAQVTQEEIQRAGRDYAEFMRKQAQDAGDDELRQSWLIERRLWESIISLRELRNDLWPPEPDPVDPPPDNPPASEEHISTIAGDVPPGNVGSIGWTVVSGEGDNPDKVLAFTTARMEPGQYAIIQVMNTEVEGWELVRGDSTRAADDTELGDYSMMLWFEYVPGVEYEVQAWVVLEDGSKGARSTQRITVE